MKNWIILFLSNFIIFNFSFGQNLNKYDETIVIGHSEGYDQPEYLVTYEVIPFIQKNCIGSSNTIIFEIPTTYEYYDSVEINQEVTSWFRVFGSESLTGNMVGKDGERWKLIIRGKRILNKEIIKQTEVKRN